MIHSEYQEMLEARALDALDPVDARALDEHLATCEQCARKLTSFRDATSLLAHAASTETPGAHVRAEILAKVRAEGRQEKSHRTQAQVVSMPQRAASPWPNLLRLAAAIAFVGLLVGVLVLWRRDARMQAEMTQLSRQLEAQRNEIQNGRELMARQQEALALMNAEFATKIQLTGMPAAPNARATFVFDKQTGRAVLMTDGLPLTAADKAYEVWFIPKGRSPMPGNVFTVDSSGHAMIMGQMPREAMDGAVIAITVEPKGGSAAPTGAMYLSSSAL